MKRLILAFILAYCALANPKPSLPKIKQGLLPNSLGKKWETNNKYPVDRPMKKSNKPINLHSFGKNIISWLKLEAQATPFSVESYHAQKEISNIIKTEPFPLSLIERIQTAFGTSVRSPFTRILSLTLMEPPVPLIRSSPCAYEKILSLSNYKKINMGAISVLVNYLQTAPKGDRCTLLLKKRVKEYFLKHHNTVLRKGNIITLAKDQVLKMPNDKILKILESEFLYAQYLPEDIQEFATKIIDEGSDDDIFKVISLNLAAHDATYGAVLKSNSYLMALKKQFDTYNRISKNSAAPQLINNEKYGPKFIALHKQNEGLINIISFMRSWGASLFNTVIENENWKRSYYRRKMDKKSGKVTFLTLEDDYNSISMGTATPAVIEAFCKDAENLLKQTAHFWNIKFNRKVTIKDALLGLCPKNVVTINAINELRMTANRGEELDCSVYRLTVTLPEFSWYLSLRNLPTTAFKHLFTCGFNLDTLVKINEYSFVLGELHQNLARAIKEIIGNVNVKDKNRFPYPSVANFLMLNKV